MKLLRRIADQVRFLTEEFSRVTFGLVVLSAIIIVGTIGYDLIEGWSVLDGLYMTVITITTVGYGETHPLDSAGRIFTITLLLTGVATALYILTALVSAIIEGDLKQVFGERRLRKKIADLIDHHIICGYGRVGEEIAQELHLRHAPFVVLDSDEATLGRARREGFLTLHGDATEETVLLEAGLARCASLIAAADSDTGNTYITLTAKSLRPDVFIVARVGSWNNESRMRQAGADRVISPYQMGGRRMAVAAMQPVLPDLMDIVAAGNQIKGLLLEVRVTPESGLADKSLEQALASTKDVVVLAVTNQRGTFIVGPAPSTHLAMGDRLMVFGSEEDLEKIGVRTGVK